MSGQHLSDLPEGITHLPLGPLERRLILLAGDEVAVALAGFSALAIWVAIARQAHAEPSSLSPAVLRTYLPFLLAALVAWPIIAWLSDLYSLTIASAPWPVAVALLRSGALLFGVYIMVYFVAPPATLPRIAAGVFIALAITGMFLWRLAYALLFKRPLFQRRVIIVGAGWAGRTIARVLAGQQGPGFTIVGFIDDDQSKYGQSYDGVPVVGGRRDLLPIVQACGITDLVLAITHSIHAELVKAMLSCQEHGVAIIPMPLLYEELTERLPVDHVGPHWSFILPANPQGLTFYRVAKRLFDVALALVGLTLFTLVLPLVASALILDSPGPIFYRQARVGRGGRVFTIWKLRTMVPDAESGQAQWADEHDPRVTRVGRLLRRVRLDEVPQLVNVLRGEMSLIGPRPERPEFVEQLEQQIPFYRARLSVLPGLTGWAQVNMGYTKTIDEALMKLQYDLYYIKHQSILLDLRILVKTIGMMAGMHGT